MMSKTLKESLENLGPIKKTANDPFNQDYLGFDFILNEKEFKYRRAKKTPTKAGYFVTLWLKEEGQNNRPYDASNMSDYLLVELVDDSMCGVFVFSKKVLIKHHIISNEDKVGKMGFRVYPCGEEVLNKNSQ